MKSLKYLSLIAPAALAFSGATASAQIVGQLWTGQSAAAGNATIGAAAGLGTPTAKFNPGAIDFDSNRDGYTLNQFLHSPAFYDTAAGFDPNATANDVYYLFTGTLFLNAGANSFVIPHDDGLQLNIDGIGLVVNQPGPTSPVDTPFTVNAPADGNYTFELSYGECCGAPAELKWTINQQPVGNVPDGGATAGLLGLGIAALAGVRARSRR